MSLLDVAQASMAIERGLRTRIPQGNAVPTLGKHLGIHQVLPAHLATRVANAPRTDIGKAVLSSVGGNPRIVNQAQSLARATKQISHYDSKLRHLGDLKSALKLAPQHKSLISH
tara:strand:- start:252 stop:593 length:342 start_codon:yes stop_codon:yes gene_type:complete